MKQSLNRAMVAFFVLFLAFAISASAEEVLAVNSDLLPMESQSLEATAVSGDSLLTTTEETQNMSSDPVQSIKEQLAPANHIDCASIMGPGWVYYNSCCCQNRTTKEIVCI